MTSNAAEVREELGSGIAVSEELLSANREVDGQMAAQERALESSTSAIEEMTPRISTISSTAKERLSLLDKLTDEAGAGSSRLQDSIASIDLVQRSSSELLEIIGVIEEIAEPTISSP
jgi:methyl-accepting chemotaxis protein